MSVVQQSERKQYLERQLVKIRDDKKLRVSTHQYKEHTAVEIRDWVRVPAPSGDGQVWHPSSGMFLPLDAVVAVRKALQAIEAEHGLVEDGGEN